MQQQQNSNPTSPQPQPIQNSPPPPPLSIIQQTPQPIEITPSDPILENKWRQIKNRLYSVLRDAQNDQLRTIPSEWEKIYNDVTFLLHHDDACRKRRLYEYIRLYIREVVSLQLDHLRPLTGTHLLSEYVRRWNSTRSYVRFMSRVMAHLKGWLSDERNTKKDDPVRPLDKLLMFFWREDLLSQLCSVVDTALSLIDDDRRGIPISHEIVRGVVDNFVEIGSAEVYTDDESDPIHHQTDSSGQYSSSLKETLYTSDDNVLPPRRNARFKQIPAEDSQRLHLYLQVFENGYVERAEKFYRHEGQRALDSRAHTDINSFLKMIMDRLDDEEKRTTRLLHQRSKERVRNVVEEQLIGTHKHFLREEAHRMIRESDEDGLRLVTNLLSRITDGLSPVRDFLCSYIRNRGIRIIKEHIESVADKEDIRYYPALIDKLISLYITQTSMVKRCFRDQVETMNFVEKGMRNIVNHPQSHFSMPILLAHYLDRFMRTSSARDTVLVEFAKTIPEELNMIPTCENVPQSVYGTDVETMQVNKAVAKKDNVLLLPLKKARTERHLRKSTSILANQPLLNDETENISDEKQFDLDSKYGLKEPLEDSKVIPDKDFETVRSRYMDEVIRFLMFIESKDVYYTQHREFFAKRLLSSYDEYLEIELINKIRDEMGTTYVGRLSGMLKDMNTDKEMRKDFESYLKKRRIVSKTRKRDGKIGDWRDHNIEDITFPYGVHVLNAQHWPKVAPIKLQLPNAFKACSKLFESFYKFSKESRKLTWVHSMSTVQLFTHWESGSFTLNLSLAQACILLLFNSKTQITVGDASKSLNISSSEVMNQLRPLLVGKSCKLLKLLKHEAKGSTGSSVKRECEPLRKRLLNEARIERSPKRQRIEKRQSETEEIGNAAQDSTDKLGEVFQDSMEETSTSKKGQADHEEDHNTIIQLNLDFRSKYARITVPTRIVKFSSKFATPEKNNNVVVERGTQIDAKLVRVMKAKKRLSHNELCADVIDELSKVFVPEPKLIKERIQRLIDQDYITRDAQDNEVYIYNA